MRSEGYPQPSTTLNDASVLKKAAGIGNLSLTETSIWRISDKK